MIKEKKTEIMIVGTMHGFHKDNQLYSYDHIFGIIEDFAPDAIGVEVREEDVNQPREYLKKYYPFEMVEAVFRFVNTAEIYGFDWFEKEMEGKLITEDYFDNFDKIKLERSFEIDTAFEKERKLLEAIDNYRFDVIKNSTSGELNDGRYDAASYIYYNQLELLLKDTPYEKLSSIYIERDKHIDKNIIKIIEVNIGKKLIFITGCDHRVFAINAIKEKFGQDVEIVKTP